MSTRIKRWLAPPVFVGDADETYRAELLNLILLATSALLAILIQSILLVGRVPTSTLILDIFFLGTLLASRQALYQRRIRLVGGGLTFLGFIFITISVANLGTIRTPTTSAFIFLVIIVEVVFGARGMLASVIASSLAIWGLMQAENARMLPAPDYAVTLNQWVFFTALFLAAGSLTFFAHKATRDALERTNKEIKDRERTEEALRVSEARFRSLFEQVHDAVLLFDLEGRVLAANQRAADMSGYPLNEIVKLSAREISLDLHRSQKVLTRLLAGDHVPLYESQVRKKDGQIVPVEINIELARDKVGNPTHIQGVVRDISQRKQAEAALRASESKYRLLFENMQEGFALHEIITDERGAVIDFRFLDANAAYEHHTGIKPQDMIGKTIREIVPHADPHQIENYVKVALTGEPLAFEYYSKTFNRHLRVRAFSPQHGRFATIFEDITERKQVEESLCESEERFHKAIEFLPIPIGLMDHRGNVLYYNRKFTECYGYTTQDISTDQDWIFNAYPDPAYRQLRKNLMANALAQSACDGLPTPIHEARVVCKDGSQRDVEISGCVIGDLTVCSFIDVTERKQNEQGLKNQRDFVTQVINTMGQGLTVTDADRRFVFVNPAYAKLFGYLPEQLIGQSPKEVTVAEEHLALDQIYSAREHGETSTYESHLIRANGTIAPVLITGAPH